MRNKQKLFSDKFASNIFRFPTKNNKNIFSFATKHLFLQGNKSVTHV